MSPSFQPYSWRRDGYELSTDPARLDVDAMPWLVERALAHPELRGLRRWSLATADAHELYARYGFSPLSRPGDHMAIERSPAELWGEGVTPA